MNRWLRRFADRRLVSELDAQKSANLKLHKACKFHRDRANALAVSKKTVKTKLTATRKELRDLQALIALYDDVDLDVRFP